MYNFVPSNMSKTMRMKISEANLLHTFLQDVIGCYNMKSYIIQNILPFLRSDCIDSDHLQSLRGSEVLDSGSG